MAIDQDLADFVRRGIAAQDAAEGHTGRDIGSFLDTARRDVTAAHALTGAALPVNVGAGE